MPGFYNSTTSEPGLAVTMAMSFPWLGGIGRGVDNADWRGAGRDLRERPRHPTPAPPAAGAPARGRAPRLRSPARRRPSPTHAAPAPSVIPQAPSGFEQCPSCGALVAADQRYCLECGHRRGDPRLPFMDAVVFMDAMNRPPETASASTKSKKRAASPPMPP